MRKKLKKSIVGYALVLLYLLITAYFVYDALTCSGMFCNLSILYPVLPWPLILEQFELIHDGKVTYWILVALNTTIVYFIGFALEIFFKKRS